MRILLATLAFVLASAAFIVPLRQWTLEAFWCGIVATLFNHDWPLSNNFPGTPLSASLARRDAGAHPKRRRPSQLGASQAQSISDNGQG